MGKRTADAIGCSLQLHLGAAGRSSVSTARATGTASVSCGGPEAQVGVGLLRPRACSSDAGVWAWGAGTGSEFIAWVCTLGSVWAWMRWASVGAALGMGMDMDMGMGEWSVLLGKHETGLAKRTDGHRLKTGRLETGDETGDQRPDETEEEAGEVKVAQTWPCPKEGLARPRPDPRASGDIR